MFMTTRFERILVALVLVLLVAPDLFGQRRRGRGRPTPPQPAAEAQAPAKEEAKKPEGPIHAFVGATIWPVSRGVIENGTMLVQDGKILAVGSQVVVPEGARIHDVSGRHLVPGFVALNARRALAVSGTSSNEKAADRFDPFSDTMLFCLSAGITTAHEARSSGGGFGGLFGGRGGGSTFSGTTQGTKGGLIAKLTYGSVDGFTLRDPAGVYFDAGFNQASQARQFEGALEKAKAYRAERQAWIDKLTSGDKEAKEPKADDRTKAIVEVMEGRLPGFVHANTRAQIEAVLEMVHRHDIPLTITGAEEAWTMAPEIGRQPVHVVFTPRGRGGMMAPTRPYRDRFKEADHGWSIETGARLESAGVRWAPLPLSPSYSLGGLAGRDLAALTMDAAFTVRGGVSNHQALRSLTLSAAEILGVDDRIGSLEKGKDADFLVMDREPLDYRSLVDEAWVNGREAYDRQEAGLWAHLRTNRSSEPSAWKPWGIWGPWPDRETILRAFPADTEVEAARPRGN